MIERSTSPFVGDDGERRPRFLAVSFRDQHGQDSVTRWIVCMSGS
jgi:hypothetical protein